MTAVPIIPEDDLALAAAWRARPTDPEQLARRLSEFLTGLRGLAPAARTWRRRPAKTVIEADDVEGLAKVIRLRIAKDSRGAPIPAMGYLLDLTSEEVPGLHVHLHAGQTEETVESSYALHLESSCTALRTPPEARSLMEAIVRAFDPDWAVWTSGLLGGAEHLTDERRSLGYLNYGWRDAMLALDPRAERFHRGAIARLGDDPELRDPAPMLDLLDRLWRSAARDPVPADPTRVPELHRIGWDLGFALVDGGSVWRIVDRGHVIIEMSREEYVVWTSAAGRPATVDGSWTLADANERAQSLAVPRPEPILRALLNHGLIAEVPALGGSVRDFCRTHRIETLMPVLGAADWPIGAALIGPREGDGIAVGGTTANVYTIGPAYPDLWSACETVASTDPSGASTPWFVAEQFLRESQRLVARGALSLQTVDAPSGGTA